MLTKKDFKAVAEIIKRQSTPRESDDVIIAIMARNIGQVYASELADYFATQNPHFDRERFMAACGLK